MCQVALVGGHRSSGEMDGDLVTQVTRFQSEGTGHVSGKATRDEMAGGEGSREAPRGGGIKTTEKAGQSREKGDVDLYLGTVWSLMTLDDPVLDDRGRFLWSWGWRLGGT